MYMPVTSPGGGGILVPAYSFFLGGIPAGGGGYKKNLRKKNFGPQNLKLPQLCPTSLGLEGARRIFFKVTIDVLADMGGICVSRHKEPLRVTVAHLGLLSACPKVGRNGT